MQNKVVVRGGQGEITEKKSRFIATIRPVHSEEEAAAFVQEMKKKYYDARHNCSAYIIGCDAIVSKSSDDGEPSGTAGRPMLDVLMGEGLYDVAVVVTRYFGGVLLGTGGLVRAYTEAVKAGIDNSAVGETKRGYRARFSIDYGMYGTMEYLIREKNLSLIASEFGESVAMDVMVPTEEKAGLEQKLTELTNGKLQIEWSEEMGYMLLGDQVEFV